MVVHSYYPLGELRGGRDARAAREAGYDVHIVCLGREREPMAETIDEIGVLRVSIKQTRGAGGVRRFYEHVGFTMLAAAEVIRLHRRFPIDIVYAHVPPDFLIAAALVPRLLGCRVVREIEDVPRPIR